jgi:DNA-directed RNA polymerase subunit RPC12/RpoP
MSGSKRDSGFGRGRTQGTGGGRRRNNGGGYSVGGNCVCAKCGEKIPHQQGVRCTALKCPRCSHTMIREELLNDKKDKN